MLDEYGNEIVNESNRKSNGMESNGMPTSYIILIVAIIIIIIAFYIFCIVETKCCTAFRKKTCFGLKKQNRTSSKSNSKTNSPEHGNDRNELQNPESEKLHSKSDSELV